MRTRKEAVKSFRCEFPLQIVGFVGFGCYCRFVEDGDDREGNYRSISVGNNRNLITERNQKYSIFFLINDAMNLESETILNNLCYVNFYFIVRILRVV